MEEAARTNRRRQRGEWQLNEQREEINLGVEEREETIDVEEREKSESGDRTYGGSYWGLGGGRKKGKKQAGEAARTNRRRQRGEWQLNEQREEINLGVEEREENIDVEEREKERERSFSLSSTSIFSSLSSTPKFISSRCSFSCHSPLCLRRFVLAASSACLI